MAPRPVTGRAQKAPWYKTTKGQTIAAISTLILLVVILAWVSNANKEADEREEDQRAIENYTEQIDALQQRISEPATAMAGAALAPPEDLGADIQEWTNAFTSAQAETGQFIAPEGATASSQLFTQSINLFKTAAETLAVAADLEGKQQQDLITAASGQVQTAGGVWDAGVTVLDEARDELGLGAAAIASPISMTPPTDVPTAPSATVPVTPGAGGGGGGDGAGNNGGGKSGGGKSKKGDDS